MNVNAGHERTSKARIIHQIQLIRGITEKSMNYITLKKNIPSLLESTTCFQVSFRRDLPQIGKARFFLSLFRFACVLNNSTAVI
ncbi:hypothetical protein [Shigella dysenteriae]|uniref:hypothetical protein n=1 Tax=Shigella dysenteriae TaxID=622 RepID=UPI0010709729|nr:hypothetical protein [Shigella dysenteriae]